MAIEKCILAGICFVLASAGAWGARPAPADTISPGPVKNLQVQSAARALTLKFTAPGDDGATGTATGYDILYTLGPCAPGLAPTPSAGLEATIASPLWTVAPRSKQTLPYAGGTTDFFNVRGGDGDGLRSGTAYCVAIRGFDEVGHTGTFAVADAATIGVHPGDDWPLTTRLATGSTPQSTPQLAYPPSSANAVLGWMLPDAVGTYAAIQFAFDGGGLYTVGKGPLKGINGSTFRMVGIPGGAGKVGAMFSGVVTGTSSVNQYMLVEVGPDGAQTPEVVASGPLQSGGLEPAASSGITYVLHNGAYNPVVALNRIVTLTSSSKVSQLELRERVGGSWATPPTVVLTQGGPASKNTYQGVELFTKPDADGTLGFVAPQCGIWIYAERRHSNPADQASPWVWRYWDVGPTGVTPSGSPAPYNDLLHVTFTDTGAPLLARISAAPPLSGAMQINHPDLTVGGSDTPPPQTCTNATSVRPNAWETVVVTPNPDFPYVRLSAVAETGGSVYLTGEQGENNNRVVEQRLLYRCNGTTEWKMVAIDRVNSCCGSPRAPLFAPDGSVVKSYRWHYASREAPAKPYSSYPGTTSSLRSSRRTTVRNSRFEHQHLHDPPH